MCVHNSQWSTCEILVLQSSLDNSNFSVMLMLVSVSCPDSWCGESFYIETWTFWGLPYETKILFESFVWTCPLQHHWDRRRRGPLWAGGGEGLGSLFSHTDTLGVSVLVADGQWGEFQSFRSAPHPRPLLIPLWVKGQEGLAAALHWHW